MLHYDQCLSTVLRSDNLQYILMKNDMEKIHDKFSSMVDIDAEIYPVFYSTQLKWHD
jgi:hypothetical protein